MPKKRVRETNLIVSSFDDDLVQYFTINKRVKIMSIVILSEAKNLNDRTRLCGALYVIARSEVTSDEAISSF